MKMRTAEPGTRPRRGRRALRAALRRGPLVAFLFALGFTYLGTGASPLWDSDETRFAEATREMFARNDFLVPWFNGEPRYDKPPLTYWVQALGYRLFGVGEAGARLPSVLGLALAAFATARIGRRVGGRGVGLAAGLLLPICLQSALIGRAATADGLLLGLVAVTIDALHARLAGRRGAGTWTLMWVGAGLCFLAKGPPGWVAPLAAGAATAYLGGRVDMRRRWPSILAGIGLAVAIPLAWAVPANVATGGDFFSRGLGHHVFERATRGFEGHGGYEPWWLLYFPPVVLLFFFPWAAFLPQGYAAWRRRDRRDRVFLGGWIFGTLLVFTLSVSKLPHYVLPLYPALAILVAVAVRDAVRSGRSLLTGRAGRFSLGYLTLLGVALGAGPSVALAGSGFRVAWVTAFALASVLGGVVAAAWILRRSGAPAAQAGLVWLGTAGAILVLVLDVLPDVTRFRIVPRAGRALAAAAPAGSLRATYQLAPEGLVFYSQRDAQGNLDAGVLRPVRELKTDEEALAFLASGSPGAMVVSASKAERLRESAGLVSLPGRRVWTGDGYLARKGRWVTLEVRVTEGGAGSRTPGPERR